MNGLFLSEILSKWDYINYILYYKVLEQYFSNIENKNKLNDIITKNPNDKTSVGVFPVCKFMTLEKQKKVCREKASKFYRFFH